MPATQTRPTTRPSSTTLEPAGLVPVPDLLPNRNLVFEFTLVEAERGLQAVDITLAGRPRV